MPNPPTGNPLSEGERLNTSLTGKQRYWQAVKKARLQFQRDLRRANEAGGSVWRCGLDTERDAIIAELDRLSAALSPDSPR